MLSLRRTALVSRLRNDEGDSITRSFMIRGIFFNELSLYILRGNGVWFWKCMLLRLQVYVFIVDGNCKLYFLYIIIRKMTQY